MSIRDSALNFGPDIDTWPVHVLREAIAEYLESDREILLQEAVMEMVETDGDCLVFLSFFRSESPTVRHALLGKLLCDRVDAYVMRNLSCYIADRWDDWKQDEREEQEHQEAYSQRKARQA